MASASIAIVISLLVWALCVRLVEALIKEEIFRARSVLRSKMKVVDGRIYHIVEVKKGDAQGKQGRRKRKITWEQTGCLHHLYTPETKDRLRAALLYHGKSLGLLRQ